MTEFKNDAERMVLVCAITSDRVLGEIVTKVRDKEPFRSRWSNLVYGWCATFYRKYGAAPRRAIEQRFKAFAEKSRDEDVVEMIGVFLKGLSRDHRSDLNEKWVLDLAAEHFNRIRMERLRDQIDADVDGVDSQRIISEFQSVSLGASRKIDVFTDADAQREALEEQGEEILVHYPNALGEFFSNHLSRDGLISFMAPEKRGKTFWLLDLAWRSAVRCKRRTLFYSMGDMSERQVMRRFLSRATRRPIVGGKIRIPIKFNEEGVPRFARRKSGRRMSMSDVRNAFKQTRMKTSHSTSLLRLRSEPNSTMNVAGVRSDMIDYAREGWMPDVVVIDYADILAPETTRDDFRHQIDETWKALRRLSQEFHCLVVTATQSNAASYGAEVIRRKHFSEDKRKFAHVTGMVGINQTDDEKALGMYRLNWTALREGAYSESRCVTVAGCLEITSPCIISTWGDDWG